MYPALTKLNDWNVVSTNLREMGPRENELAGPRKQLKQITLVKKFDSRDNRPKPRAGDKRVQQRAG